jgi:hypothetical protein
MNQTALEQMLSTGKITAAEVLADAPLEALDEAPTMLMWHRPAKEASSISTGNRPGNGDDSGSINLQLLMLNQSITRLSGPTHG